jgi:hypothetical protein
MKTTAKLGPRRGAAVILLASLALQPHSLLAQAPAPNAPAPGAQPAATPNAAAAPKAQPAATKYDAAAFQEAVNTIVKAFDEGDHARLDSLHDEYLELLRKGGEGRRMLDAFAAIFEQYYRAEHREQLEKMFAAWKEAAPQSKLRPAAEGAMYRAFAWEARGAGPYSQVPEDARKKYRENLEHSTQVIEQGQAQGRETPLWYWTAITTGGAIGAPPRALDRFFEEGAARFPLYMPLYYARLTFLLPQWGGDFARVDGFIRAAVARTQATEGTTFYSILYADVVRSSPSRDFFHDTRASWPLMKHALEDELALGTGDLNRYTAFACLARDRETTRELIAELGDNLQLGTSGPITNDSCKELADGK